MKKLVENHEYQIKDFKVHLSRQANHSLFTNFNFVFSPFTKIKNTSLNPVSHKNFLHPLFECVLYLIQTTGDESVFVPVTLARHEM